MDHEAAAEAVRMLIRGSSRFPAVADIRELYVPLRRRQAQEQARKLGLPEPERAVPPAESLVEIRKLAAAWGSSALADFADRMEVMA